MEFSIEKVNGKWLVDGKQYQDLNYDQRLALDEFMIECQINKELYKENEVIDLSVTQEKLKEAFHSLSLLKGAKHRAFDIYGCSGNYFRLLLDDPKTASDKLMQMYQAVKQAAKESLDKIKEINVEIAS